MNIQLKHHSDYDKEEPWFGPNQLPFWAFNSIYLQPSKTISIELYNDIEKHLKSLIIMKEEFLVAAFKKFKAEMFDIPIRESKTNRIELYIGGQEIYVTDFEATTKPNEDMVLSKYTRNYILDSVLKNSPEIKGLILKEILKSNDSQDFLMHCEKCR